LKGQMTVLMVSHDSEQVRRIADRVTHLRATDAHRFGGQAREHPTNPTNQTNFTNRRTHEP